MSKHHKTNKQLSSYDRFMLLKYLSLEYDIPKIAEFLGVHKSTIYRELRRNTIVENRLRKEFCGSHTIPCKNAKNCKKKHHGCIKNCHDHIAMTCSLITKPYQICNFCIRKRECRYEKVIYHPEIAHDLACKRRANGKTNIKLNEESLRTFDEYVSPLIIAGQSIEVIHSYSNKTNFPVSTKTLRNYIDKGLMTAKNLDLRRKVRRNPSKKAKKSHNSFSRDPLRKIDHLYEDYVDFMRRNPGFVTFQCDSIIGKRKDKKTVLSIHADKFHYQQYFLLKHHTPWQVVQVFNMLKKKFGKELYYRIFKVILVDNGTEFDSILALEEDNDENYQTKVFYTRPYNSNDKAECERNHEFFRYIRSKGKTFETIDEQDIFLINSHVNSYPRKSLGWKTPIELMKEEYGDDVIKLLGVMEVKRQDVNLTSKLIKK